MPIIPLSRLLNLPNDSNIQSAINQVGEFRLRSAFKAQPFIYGTQAGENPAVFKAAQFLAGPQYSGGLKNFGQRVNEYLQKGYQMMDLYYGDEGTCLHELRNHTIGAYVHHAMGFIGAYREDESGRESYLRKFGRRINSKGKLVEGWEKPPSGRVNGFDYPDPNNPEGGLTATKEMSRIIRFGIKYFEGTLIFEGMNVTYRDVFTLSGDGIRISDGDTIVEARELMPYFAAHPGESRVPYDNGTLVFQWNNQEVAPTKSLFESMWAYARVNPFNPSALLGQAALKLRDAAGNPLIKNKSQSVYHNKANVRTDAHRTNERVVGYYDQFPD